MGGLDTYIENNLIPTQNEDQELNVSLLAAKALYFDEYFKDYALL